MLMALLWMDGFDHYGDDEQHLLDGVYAERGSDVSLRTSNPRTGAAHIRIAASSANTILRRVLGGERTTVGIACALWLDNLPSSNERYAIFDFRDSANDIQMAVGINTTGTITAYRGSALDSGTLLGTSSEPAIVTGAYQHVEVKVHFSQTVGTIEVRINGVTVLSLSGLDTVPTGLVECSQVALRGSSVSGTTAHIDDLFCYDDTGTQNNDFIGDRRVLTVPPDQDTAQADWAVVGAASGFEAINELSPDDDTSYISASTVNAISEFGIGNVPAGVSVISAVQVVNRMRKDDAGTANVQASLVSSAAESNGADRPITEVYTYWQDVHELDPATAAPWTPDALNAALLKFERTA